MDNFQFKRSDRVAQQIQDIISNIIATKVIVQGLGLATVTKVKTSQNLRFSRIYLSFMGNSILPEELIILMNRNVKEYRFHLGKELQIKYVPQIKFYHDNTFEEMEKISNLINKSKSDGTNAD
ncbi:MAG: ribosome-binding factor A [Candidatus Marinimicrobia bacterium]|nr:ribosome-binding factor A [Candidatus Neomarinimicrobiota bacterium]MBV66776.1 ribosome-binding factor A [Candidatus Neomarinimicrobiota bacterium]